MAYLRVSFNNEEIDRRDLAGPLVIGRSPQCDLAVRDILLSRMHCRIEPGSDEGWNTSDLSSKNGTTVNGQPLTSGHRLTDGDVLRLGRVKVLFCAGCLADGGLTPLRNLPWRPADPAEALSNSGTFVGVGMIDADHSTNDPVTVAGAPNPRPEPPVPEAYAREDVYSLLTTIASSSWDSIYAEARRPVPAVGFREERRGAVSVPRLRPRSPIDLSLQVRATVGDVPPRPAGGRLGQRGLWLVGVSVLLVFCWLIHPQTPLEGPVAHPSAAATLVSSRNTPASSVALFEAAAAVLPILL